MMSDSGNRFPRLSRRTVLGLLGIGAGWELTSMWREGSEGGAVLQAADSRSEKLIFPKGAIIRTVLKDIPPGELTPGATLFHEHIAADTVDDVVIEELNAAKEAGVSCIVNAKSERPLNVANLKTISTRTNMHIVACTGFYMEYTYPPELATKSEDQIAEDFVQEAKREGFGAYGEMGQSPNTRELSPAELKVFRAAGKAHLRTNLPIFTHNPYGTGPNVPREAGLLQLDAFEAVGVKPQSVAVGHTCCLDDPKADIIKQIAKRGAFVGFDRMEDFHPALPPGARPRLNGTVHDVPDEQRVKEVLELLDAGYEKNLLLADDSTIQPLKISEEIGQLMKDHWLTEADAAKIKTMIYRSMGLGRSVSRFVPKLRKAGVKEKTLHTILYDNPRRFLAFEPKDS
jgi:predicted metal-dependent phosphotriesterase family hydrolase